MKRVQIILLIIISFVYSCKTNSKYNLPIESEVLHKNENNLRDIIIYDIFSPPVAARIYAYTSLAAYEAIRYADNKEESIVSKLRGFSEMPKPEPNKKYNFVLAASKAFYTVATQLTFSKDTVLKYETETYLPFKNNLNAEVYNNSIAFGEAIAAGILKRVDNDNYKQTRSLEKNYGSKVNGKWTPTSPDYLDAVEPYWEKIVPFVLTTSHQFNPLPPPLFSENKNSDFYKMNMDVYETGKNLTTEQKDIALFWDDNPLVTEHSGHMMLATKKQTPGGHWMGIATIACRAHKADAITSAKTYALTAVALFEAFISVFDTKYFYSYVRPITIINKFIDPNWDAFLQTPAFPEYTSGHSTISASAAIVLSKLYGNNFSFMDTSNLHYINKKRKFNSFIQASNECSISRYYGGIHFKISVDNGAEVGKKIGQFVISKINIQPQNH